MYNNCAIYIVKLILILIKIKIDMDYNDIFECKGKNYRISRNAKINLFFKLINFIHKILF